jgi:hypothetical protein
LPDQLERCLGDCLGQLVDLDRCDCARRRREHHRWRLGTGVIEIVEGVSPRPIRFVLDDIGENRNAAHLALLAVQNIDRAGQPHDAVNVLAVVTTEVVRQFGVDAFDPSKIGRWLLQLPESLKAAAREYDYCRFREELADATEGARIVDIDMEVKAGRKVLLPRLLVPDRRLESVDRIIDVRVTLARLDPRLGD